ncbi:MAG TPA: hypothetical protein VI937_01105 [Negativicutes bacterium]|nr:hypothetical protein [Negativicutes bacterium]
MTDSGEVLLENSEALGGEFMADAMVRFLDGQIAVTSNLVAMEALKNVRKEVLRLKEYAIKKRMLEVVRAWR